MMPSKPSNSPGSSSTGPEHTCRWRDCTYWADHIMLYGCLQMHLGEIPLCNPHVREWKFGFLNGNFRCPERGCKGKLADFLSCELTEVHL